MRLACGRKADGSWDNVAVTKVQVPTTADANSNGTIGCGEADDWLDADGTYGDSDTRRIRFFDTSINTGGPFSGWCFYGYSFASDDTRPGMINSNNTDFGAADVDADKWPRGATNYVTSGVLQELGHSIGLVQVGADGGVDSGYGSGHTRDYHDYMNAGYFYPGCTIEPTCGNIRRDCRPMPTTFKDTYVDCSRDTYWDPTPTSGEWLCTHYNIATDSPISIPSNRDLSSVHLRCDASLKGGGLLSSGF
jgi:hypothetical protein